MNYLGVKKKYKGYQIIQQGYKDSIPFTMLSGVTDTTEIKGIEVYDKPSVSIDVTLALFG